MLKYKTPDRRYPGVVHGTEGKTGLSLCGGQPVNHYPSTSGSITCRWCIAVLARGNYEITKLQRVTRPRTAA